ncbi:MAG TPA: SUMF1/EgtB/PvdO family nonheme iron enzyme [Pyrinomonadaceae bacterium]|jgi:hypothetical protein
MPAHFISYSSTDAAEFALRLRDELEAGPPSIPVWHDRRDIRPGQDWDKEIDEALKTCLSLIFVMTRDSVEDGSVCKREWTRALSYKKPIIPIKLHADAAMPFRLEPRHYIDFTRVLDSAEQFNAAVARLRKHLGWLASPAGALQALRDRFADAQRELRRAQDPSQQARIRDEIDQLKKEITKQEEVIRDPSGAASRHVESATRDPEREARPGRPAAGARPCEPYEPPPDAAHSKEQQPGAGRVIPKRSQPAAPAAGGWKAWEWKFVITQFLLLFILLSPIFVFTAKVLQRRIDLVRVETDSPRTAFYIGRTEVTQAEWESLMGADANPSRNRGSNLPVENVSWEDARKFIVKLNQMNDDLYYFLPTEAQWEYACRAGGKDADDAATLSARAWYRDTPGTKQTHPPKGKDGNAYRLHDMQGNVWEWCADGYYENRGGPPEGEVTGEGDDHDTQRVLRGGAFDSSAEECRCSFRRGENAYAHIPNIGFRVAARTDFWRVMQPGVGR